MYILFDFDGTLVDSFPTVIQKFNCLADEFKFKKMDLGQLDQLKDLSSKELIKQLGIPCYKLPAVLAKGRRVLQPEILNLLPFPKIIDLLSQLVATGFSLGIVTSNSKENVLAWLNQHGLQSYFELMHCESSYFGKKRILKKIVRTHRLSAKTTIYVGDETRDIEAAKACQLISIAVTWGFNSERVLAASYPDYLACVPEDIISYVKKLMLSV